MMELLIKNMVCDRCIRVVKEELEKAGIAFSKVELGRVETESELSEGTREALREALAQNGFELLDDKRQALVEYIRKLIIEEVQQLKGNKPEHMNFSEFLSLKTGYEYSYLSHLFSTETRQTIEQYLIAQRIEKAKEWLSYNELSVGEIAWRLGYSSVAHLSNQFKKVTGLSPAAYKSAANKDRIALDRVGENKV